MSLTCKTPQLRFREFSGEWEEKKLITLSQNGFSNGAFNDPKKVGQGYRIINVKDMYVDGTIDIDNLTRVAIDEKEFSKNRVEYGDIFFTRSSLVKEGIAYSNVNLNSADDLTFDGHLIRMRPNKEKCSSIFLYYNFTTREARKQFIIRGKTTTMTTIGQEDIASVVICLPSKPEQEKIASFLSAVDGKIEKLTCKAKLLEEYKKGVMQSIFSQTIRFKDDDGSEYPEWVEKKLGEIGQTYNGLTGKTADDFGNGKPYIQYKQIFDNSRIDISRFGYVDIKPNDKQNKAQYGDTFFTTSSETPLEVGFSSVLLDKVDEVYLNSFCFGFRPKSLNILNPLFARFLFRSSLFRKDVVKLAQGSTRYNMSKVELMKIIIKLPSEKEQTKIANFLSSIDAKLLHVNKQLNTTKEFKKALLQQMFV